MGVHAAALYFIRFPAPQPAEAPTSPARLDLALLKPTPIQNLSAEVISQPISEPAIPENTASPEESTPTPPPKVKPSLSAPSRPGPTIIKKQLPAQVRTKEDPQEKAEQEKIARNRLEEKRRKEKAARAAAAKKHAAAKKRAALARKIATKPSPTSRRKPIYPRSSRRAGHQGTTVLSINIGTNGRVTAVQIAKSSGHAALDQAAVSVARTWEFSPARNGLGQAIPYTMSAPIPFKLR
jgi:protein TonB